MCVSAILSLSGIASAENSNSKTFPLKKERREKTELPPDPWNHRMPSAPVMCIISENGIFIDGVGYHFNLYEVYDEDGTCLISSSSEEDFITFIFIVDENVEVRLYTDNFVFYGWW